VWGTIRSVNHQIIDPSAGLPRYGNGQPLKRACAIRVTRLPLLLSIAPPSLPRLVVSIILLRAHGIKTRARAERSNNGATESAFQILLLERQSRGPVALCSYVALLIASTQPSLHFPNRPRWSPPIFGIWICSQLGAHLQRKYQRTSRLRAWWLRHNESRQQRMQQEIDDLDLLYGSVRSCQH
jgi:hypothetical protein